MIRISSHYVPKMAFILFLLDVLILLISGGWMLEANLILVGGGAIAKERIHLADSKFEFLNLWWPGPFFIALPIPVSDARNPSFRSLIFANDVIRFASLFAIFRDSVRSGKSN